jgi:hypothetical protein
MFEYSTFGAVINITTLTVLSHPSDVFEIFYIQIVIWHTFAECFQLSIAYAIPVNE